MRSDAQADRAAEFVAHGLGAEPTRDSLAKVPFEKLSDLPKLPDAWLQIQNGPNSLTQRLAFQRLDRSGLHPELPVDALQKGAARKMASS